MPDPAPVIDLRSDTVTRPSPEMRQAMASATVGDDQYGEDPSVNLLQLQIATLLGKEAALFVPSGTMANQIALRLLTRPGDDVIVGKNAHMMWHEAGAAAANSGVQFSPVGQGGKFTVGEFREAVKPRGHIVLPPTGLVAIENTHNMGGGIVFPQTDAVAICAAAREAGIASYLDGARLFNAAAASGLDLAELARPFDLISVALSKGLGCPVGSVLAGGKALIARRHRAAAIWRGDAAVGHPGGCRALRARPQCRPARGGSRQCAADRRARRRASRHPPRPRDGAEQHRDLGHGGRRARRGGARRQGESGRRADLGPRRPHGPRGDTYGCQPRAVPGARPARSSKADVGQLTASRAQSFI